MWGMMEPGNGHNLATLGLVAAIWESFQTTTRCPVTSIDLWNISMPVTVVFWGSRLPGSQLRS